MKPEEEILTKEISEDRYNVISEIIQTSSFINNLCIKYLRPYNISPQQCNILKILRDSDPEALTMQMIRKKMVDSTPHITRMVDKLEKQSYVKRIRCENDRRLIYVRLTDEGLFLTSKLDLAQERLLEYTDRLTHAELNTLSLLLEKLRG